MSSKIYHIKDLAKASKGVAKMQVYHDISMNNYMYKVNNLRWMLIYFMKISCLNFGSLNFTRRQLATKSLFWHTNLWHTHFLFFCSTWYGGRAWKKKKSERRYPFKSTIKQKFPIQWEPLINSHSTWAVEWRGPYAFVWVCDLDVYRIPLSSPPSPGKWGNSVTWPITKPTE